MSFLPLARCVCQVPRIAQAYALCTEHLRHVTLAALCTGTAVHIAVLYRPWDLAILPPFRAWGGVKSTCAQPGDHRHNALVCATASVHRYGCQQQLVCMYLCGCLVADWQRCTVQVPYVCCGWNCAISPTRFECACFNSVMTSHERPPGCCRPGLTQHRIRPVPTCLR